VCHCRCSRWLVFPSKRKPRRRQKALTLLSLPEDVLLYVLKCLPAEDILSVRVVHPQLKLLVDNNTSVWASANFQEVWPSPDNRWLFERAAESGNFEAAVKLGIAYLYNEGLSVSDEGRAEVNGLKASRFFSLTESLNVHAAPFIWLFIRPPWSVTGSCCKAVVYESLKTECQMKSAKKGSLLYCLAKVLTLFEGEDQQALSMFEESSNEGCLLSSYLLWEYSRSSAMSDPGRNLQSFRKLRDYANKGCWEAQISLAKVLGSRNQLGLDLKTSNEMASQIFQSSHAFNRQSVFTVQKGMNDTMRYILIDWLVEVATMKDFSSLCLHVTVSCVDRYLAQRPVPRAKLQLLGIACMVICTRFISKDILTIREAVWLTDNTYKYEDLVRMMGEIISALEGRIRTPTVLDYADVLLIVASVNRNTCNLYSYICELSLLHTGLSVFSPACIAAAALLLAKILHGQTFPWSNQLSDFTGFTFEDLKPCVLSLHKKCFHDDAPKDYRQVSLMAVKQRYEDNRCEQISKEKVLSACLYFIFSFLLSSLKAHSVDASKDVAPAAYRRLYCGPQFRDPLRRREDSIHEDRATPTAELSNQEETLLGDFLDWSLDTSCSGYEGDRESEGEKDGDVTAASVVLDSSLLNADPEPHCCRELSDEESFTEEPLLPALLESNKKVKSQRVDQHITRRQPVAFCARREPKMELSSGYSSVSSGSPFSVMEEESSKLPLASTSGLSPYSSTSTHSPLTLDSPESLQPACTKRGDSKRDRRQVKRKNTGEHCNEKLNLGFLSL
uniref:Cyclin-F n=1 Tax=Latimeria chalumnae TaxID=7897 RepID=H3AY82_LATCH